MRWRGNNAKTSNNPQQPPKKPRTRATNKWKLGPGALPAIADDPRPLSPSLRPDPVAGLFPAKKQARRKLPVGAGTQQKRNPATASCDSDGIRGVGAEHRSTCPAAVSSASKPKATAARRRS